MQAKKVENQNNWILFICGWVRNLWEKRILQFVLIKGLLCLWLECLSICTEILNLLKNPQELNKLRMHPKHNSLAVRNDDDSKKIPEYPPIISPISYIYKMSTYLIDSCLHNNDSLQTLKLQVSYNPGRQSNQKVHL